MKVGKTFENCQAWFGGVDGSAGPVVAGGTGVSDGPSVGCGARFLLVNKKASSAIMTPAAAIPP